jgi:spermidine synthase
MFYHMVREWGEGSELQYCNKILEYLDRHLPEKQGEKHKILVVGFGMGRILHEIRKRYSAEHV